MKPIHTEEVQRILILLQLDAQRLMERIKKREKEYLHRFNISRTRSHFKDIFANRYEEISISTLKNISEEVIISADNFYTQADNLHWYFKQTEDMGVAAEDYCAKTICDIQAAYNTLTAFLRAEITGETE
ncbi:MAG: hypothetical protein DRQ88_07540 [Epsilonproteobacteria bacterium]|nr:MAG: hypothetical protein DRQ89_03405 [Campylobacterota bacterium]RLA66176.1 MAG: hypothetical protein DRQ88_07540 [Campylobacterota bacterium]